MKKIPTAEEYALENMQDTDMQEIEASLIEFAKLHVKAALEKAAKEAYIVYKKRTKTMFVCQKRFVVNGGDVYEIEKHVILNAYPKELIL